MTATSVVPPPMSTMSARLVDRQTYADRRRGRLLDQVDLARAGAADHPRAIENPRVTAPGRDLARALDEVLEHPLGDVEVGDHPVLQRAQCRDVLRRAAQHRLGLVPDRNHGVVRLVDRDDRRLVEHDAPVPHEHERVGRPQVDGQVGREEPQQAVSQHWSLAKAGKSCATPSICETPDSLARPARRAVGG